MKDQFGAYDSESRLHQFGEKEPPGIFLGYELIAGAIWNGDILIADLEDLEKFDASEIYPRRINAKEVLISQKDDEFIFPVADGTGKLSGRDCGFRATSPRREQLVRSEDLSGEFPGTEKMTLKPGRDFWSIQGDFIYRHPLNLEFNSMCRRMKHSLFHFFASMLLGPLTLIWMSCKRNVSMTIGMSI